MRNMKPTTTFIERNFTALYLTTVGLIGVYAYALFQSLAEWIR